MAKLSAVAAFPIAVAVLSATDVFIVSGVPADDVPTVAGVPTVVNIPASCIYDVGVLSCSSCLLSNFNLLDEGTSMFNLQYCPFHRFIKTTTCLEM